MNKPSEFLVWWIWTSRLILAAMALLFFVPPVWMTLRSIHDPGLYGDGIPRVAWPLHQSLSERYANWARDRLAQDGGAKVDQFNISGTEWPVFGSLFYLQATESLQEAWNEDPVTKVAPAVYARDAIVAATELLLDKGHASWVIKHWGEDRYMDQDNVFYRMLRIGGMTAYTRLLGDEKYLPQLREETEHLARDIDESPAGLLDDYPNECYPGDVMMAWLAIKRADSLLGTDHSLLIERGIRGFVGPCADKRGLPPYLALRDNGGPIGPARGCSNAYMGFTAPHLWPDTARQWYAAFEEHYWRQRHGIWGFLEFPEEEARYWYADVDSGPVIDGFSTSGSAFGVGAARANGRFDHAYPLALEMIATAWTLPNGVLLGPRVLSDATEAPLLGEACILFNLTRRAAPGVETQTSTAIPPYVFAFLAFYLGSSAIVVGACARDCYRLYHHAPVRVPLAAFQGTLAVIAGIVAVVFWLGAGVAVALPALLLTVVLPWVRLPVKRPASNAPDHAAPTPA